MSRTPPVATGHPISESAIAVNPNFATLAQTAMRAVGPAIVLAHRPNTLNFLPAESLFAILQTTHHLAAGAPHAGAAIRGVGDAQTARDVYRKNRAAAVAFLTLVPPRSRAVLFRHLITFVQKAKSLAGLEGVYLSALNGVARDGNGSLTTDAVSLWQSLRRSDARDGGDSSTVYFDMAAGSFSFLDGGALDGIATALGHGNGSSIVGSGLGTVINGSGVAGSSAASGVGDAATAFLTDIFGSQLLSDVQTFAGLASQTITGAVGGLEFGTAIGSALFPGIGSAIGGAIGFFVGFFVAAIDGAEAVAGQQGAATMQTEIDQLNAALTDLQVAAQKLNDAFPAPVATSDTSQQSGNTSDIKSTTKDDTAQPAAGDNTNSDTTQNNNNSDEKQNSLDNAAKDTSSASNPTPPKSDMPASDVGNDDVGGGGSGGRGDPNNFDVAMHWPQLDNGGGGSVEPGSQGDTLGQRRTVSLHPTGHGGMGYVEGGGLGGDTGPPEPVIPVEGPGGLTNDPGGQLDTLGQRLVPHRIGTASLSGRLAAGTLGTSSGIAARTATAVVATPTIHIVIR